MALEEELMEKEEVKEVEVKEKNYNDLTDEEVEAVKELKASA
jgi:predicted DNA binding protein